MDKRNLRWLLLTPLVIGMLLLAACSSPAATPTPPGDDSSEMMEEEHDEGEEQEADEHMEDDEHEEGDEHADDEHVEDEHEDGDDHAEDEHDEGDEHAEDDHTHAAVPHEFEDLENPFAGDAASVAAGEELFGLYCASCHGETGMGDGPAAAGLDPKPASLADASMMSDVSDAYIYWRVTEGGAMEPFNSAMPPWGEILSEDQRWQLVSFVRSLAE